MAYKFAQVPAGFATSEPFLELLSRNDSTDHLAAAGLLFRIVLAACVDASQPRSERAIAVLCNARRSDVARLLALLLECGLTSQDSDGLYTFPVLETAFYSETQKRERDKENAARRRAKEKTAMVSSKETESRDDKRDVATAESDVVTTKRDVSTYKTREEKRREDKTREERAVLDLTPRAQETQPTGQGMSQDDFERELYGDTTDPDRDWAWPPTDPNEKFDFADCPKPTRMTRFDEGDLQRVMDYVSRKARLGLAAPALPGKHSARYAEVALWLEREALGRFESPTQLAIESLSDFYASTFADKYRADNGKRPPMDVWLTHAERNAPWRTRDAEAEAKVEALAEVIDRKPYVDETKSPPRPEVVEALRGALEILGEKRA